MHSRAGRITLHTVQVVALYQIVRDKLLCQLLVLKREYEVERKKCIVILTIKKKCHQWRASVLFCSNGANYIVKLTLLYYEIQDNASVASRRATR